MTTESDRTADWLERARHGDDGAFERIYEHYKGPLFRFLYGWVNHRETARDLTHETFLRLYRALPRLRSGTCCEPVLYRIARNAAIDELRRQRRRPWMRERAGRAQADPDQAVSAPTASPAEAQLQAEGSALVAEAIGRLSPRLREVFWMVVVLGEPLGTAALRLGLKPETAKKRLARARIQVREHLQRHGIAPSS